MFRASPARSAVGRIIRIDSDQEEQLRTGILSALLALASSVPVSLFGGDLRPDSLSELQILLEVPPDPRFWDVLGPERYLRNKSSEIVLVPDPTRIHVLFWARKVIKPEWLPADLDQLLVGVRDINQDERGHMPEGWVSDSVLAGYEVRGFRFYIIENGLHLSLRIHFPADVKIRDDDQSVANSLMRFLNLPASVFDAARFSMTWSSPLFYGSVEPDEFPPSPNGLVSGDWWDSLSFASDGVFLFVSVREVRAGVWNNVRPHTQPRPPDRF